MSLHHKAFQNGREMYLYYPGERTRTPYKRSAITVLMDGCDADGVARALSDWGLRALADDHEIVLAFPVPRASSWREEPLEGFQAFQDGMIKPDDEPLAVNAVGIPTLASMLNTWHPMNDVKYVVGVGGGADYALSLGARKPDNIAAIWAVGGKLDARGTLTHAPMPVWLTDADPAAARYFRDANQTDAGDDALAYNRQNPLQRVMMDSGDISAARVRLVWDALFSRVRRTNTGAHGDVEPRIGDVRRLFECFVEDDRLGGVHTWFVRQPSGLKPGERVPLMVFFHGGSDNPAEAIEMSGFHALGESERFITVYPWATNRCAWNSAMLPDLDDDVAYSARLIRFMLRNYPVDARRVYLSGFSNGAAQAQSVALLHPDLVAAICPIDANWPGVRGGFQPVDYASVIPFARGMARKSERDYRMPVWYTYGSREPSYPVFRGSTQQNQYDFWKLYNNIEIRPTPAVGEPNPTGCGVAGDVTELLRPSARHPHHEYDVQRFFSRDDPPMNLYNYVVMRDKGHEIAEMDAALGWRYVKRFVRNADGSVGWGEDDA